MEIGHNVMHGQWDWMNDPDIHSSVWDWDTASSAEAWKHSHNFIHHTFTNIRRKDKDLGYEIMRIDPNQKWHPAYLAQPFYNMLLTALFEWGVAVHDMDIEAIRSRREAMVGGAKGSEKHRRQGAFTDHQGLHRLAADQRRRVRIGTARFARAARSAGGVSYRQATPEDIGQGRTGAAASLPRPGVARRGKHIPAHVGGRCIGQRHPQRVVARHHFLRAFSRPDLHFQPGRSRGRDARGVVSAPVGRRGQHRGQPAVPCDQRQPGLSSGAPPVSGYAKQSVLGDRSEDQGHLRALRAAV